MKKEYRVKAKQIEKDIHDCIRSNVKPSGCKSTTNWIFNSIGDLFVVAFYYLRFLQNICEITVQTSIKLRAYDELFWDVLCFEEPFPQRDSLRANGAFAAPSFLWGKKTYLIADNNEVDTICHQIITNFCAESADYVTTAFEEEDFDTYILKQSGFFDENVMKILAAIHSKRYDIAKSIAEKELSQGNIGRYINRNVGFNEYALAYLKQVSIS